MSQVCLPGARGAAQVSRLSARLIRLCWLVVGHGALLLFAARIALSREGFLAGSDLAFWLAVAFVLGIRYVDITRFHAQTLTHEPATLSHWRDYAAVTILFSLGLWLLSHGLAMLAESV